MTVLSPVIKQVCLAWEICPSYSILNVHTQAQDMGCPRVLITSHIYFWMYIIGHQLTLTLPSTAEFTLAFSLSVFALSSFWHWCDAQCICSFAESFFTIALLTPSGYCLICSPSCLGPGYCEAALLPTGSPCRGPAATVRSCDAAENFKYIETQ